MSLSEVLIDIRESLQEVQRIRVFGVLMQPFAVDGKNMSCYTSLDLSNPTLLEYNTALKGDYLKVYCIHSSKYIILNNNKSIRKSPVSDRCESCTFTPATADHFGVVVDYMMKNPDDKADGALTKQISDILKGIGTKFNIDIQFCTLKPVQRGIGLVGQ